MEDGFCVIEFIDGPHGPQSDYIHILANAAYERHAGIPNVVGQKLREMVAPQAADDWVAHYGSVLKTGTPIRFERELEETGRYLSLSSFRIEPAERRQVAVLFQDITARRQAEEERRELNRTLEARVAEALKERRILADIVEGANAFVQVLDPQGNLLAINSALANELGRVLGVKPVPGDNLYELLGRYPSDLERAKARWSRALAGEEFVEIAEFGGGEDKRHFELRFSPLRDDEGGVIGA